MRIILLFLFISSFSIAQSHDWTRTNPGAGGAFGTVDGGPLSTVHGTAQIIVGSDLSGGYYSWDNGQSWETYGGRQGLTITHISALGFHPTDANIFFLGGDGGIFKSDDEGTSFTEVLSTGYITDVEVSPVNDQIVYAAFHSAYNQNDGQVYKSIDGGDTFFAANNTGLPAGLHLLEVTAHPLDVNILYALSGKGRFATGPASAFRSLDGGNNWEEINPSFGDAVMHLAITGNTLYLTTMFSVVNGDNICVSGNNGELYRSLDSGDSWLNGAEPVNSFSGVIFLDDNNPDKVRLLDPRCPYYWLPDAGTYTSTDGGISFAISSNISEWDTGFQPSDAPHWSYGTSYNGIAKTLGRSKHDPDAIFWVQSQWAFGSFDGGTVFDALHTKAIGNGWQSTGIDNIVMLEIAISDTDPEVIYTGFADMGFWRSTDGGESWEANNPPAFTGNWQGFGGNCHSIVADPDVPGQLWAALQGDANEPVHLLFSSDSAAPGSWVSIGEGIPAGSSQVRGLCLDENSEIYNRTLFASVHGDIYRSQNHGNNWSKVLHNGSLDLAAVDRVNGQIVYAGGFDGLYRSEQGGDLGTWEKIVDIDHVAFQDDTSIYREDYMGISSIEPDATVAGKTLFTLYGTNDGSTEGGVYVWENEAATLIYSNPYMRCVKANPNDASQLYAGSSYAYYRGFWHPNSEGVLYSADGGDNWEQVNGEMAWDFAVCMDISTEPEPRIFVGSPGTGFQYATVGGTVVGSPPTANFSANTTAGCAPFEVQFINSSSANTTNVIWSFAGGNPNSSTEMNPVVTYEMAGVYDVTLTATNVNGENTTTETAYVTVNDVPTADFNSLINNAVATFTNSSSNATTYAWDFGDNAGSSTDASPNYTYSEDGIYTVSLVATNQCGSTTSTQQITIVTPPTAGFVAANTVGCAPFEVSFSNQSSENAVSFAWEFEGGTPATSTAENPIVVFENSGTYSVTLTVTNAADENTFEQLNFITVEDIPDAAFQFQTTDLEVNFNNTSENGDTYFWDFGDNNQSTFASPTHTYAASGTYTVTLTVTNDCGEATFTQNVQIIVDNVADIPGLETFKLFPNPNSGIFTIVLEGQLSKEMEWNFYNLIGQKVVAKPINFTGSLIEQVDLANFPKGVYVLEIKSAEYSIYRKVVLE